MIRPRGGNFVYTSAELQTMEKSIVRVKTLGVHGIVLGILQTNEKELDIAAIKQLTQVAAPLPVTVHKAIDCCDDPLREMILLKEIGVHGILTSGKAATALQGCELLKQMVRLAGNAMQVIAAGKITPNNLEELHQIIQAPAYHGRKIV